MNRDQGFSTESVISTGLTNETLYESTPLDPELIVDTSFDDPFMVEEKPAKIVKNPVMDKYSKAYRRQMNRCRWRNS